MTSYLRNYWQKIKDTKKFAREKNTIWILPVFDALVISVLFSWQLSVGTLENCINWKIIRIR